jgi:hypothetical protein
MEYLMMYPNDCGPAVLSAVTGKSREEIYRAWGIKNILEFRDLHDTPINHFACLSKLGIPWKIRTLGDIFHGFIVPNKTIVLLHSLPKDGIVGSLAPLLSQHWVVLEYASQVDVKVHWGDGTIKYFKRATFEKLYSGAIPACAYEVGIGSTKLTWYQKFYAWLTGKFV